MQKSSTAILANVGAFTTLLCGLLLITAQRVESREEVRMWGHGPAMKRLLNDVNAASSDSGDNNDWDARMETLSSDDFFREPLTAQGKAGRRSNTSRAGANLVSPRRSSLASVKDKWRAAKGWTGVKLKTEREEIKRPGSAEAERAGANGTGVTPMLESAESGVSDWDLRDYAEGGEKINYGF
ncbi:hypothetical protein HDV00_006424 [Rhizophlyctis rosea]|nr:hypothetical protein HDV00_006424 [Rhizophlyctis rosea]